MFFHIDGKVTKNFLVHDEICYKCKHFSPFFKTHNSCNKVGLLQVVTCFYYNHYLKRLILQFKYFHKRKLGKDLAKLMKNFYLANNLPLKNTALTFVPMHWWRKYFIKGYNQAEVLANYLGDMLDLPVIKICKKTKNTKVQANLSKQERMQNLQNVFSPIDLDFEFGNLVIVDDLITTGATLENLVSCIKKQFKNLNVYAIVLARR